MEPEVKMMVMTYLIPWSGCMLSIWTLSIMEDLVSQVILTLNLSGKKLLVKYLQQRSSLRLFYNNVKGDYPWGYHQFSTFSI